MTMPIPLIAMFALVAAVWFLGHTWSRPTGPPPMIRATDPSGQESAVEHAMRHLDSTYVCPMHPDVVRNGPGRCPICGMDLVLRLVEEISAAPVGADYHSAPAPAIRVSSAMINQLGVRTAPVRRGTLERHVEAVGAYFEITAPVFRGSVPEASPPPPASRNVVLAQVFEGHAPVVRVGQAGEIRIPALGSRTWKGTIESVDPQVNQGTRTLQFRVGFDPEGVVLKPGSSARVHVEIDPIHDVLLLPREAVIATGRGARVVVALGGGRFEPRPVVVDDFGEDEVIVRSGLEEGDTVVVSAQFLLDSEANLQAGLRRFSDEGEGAPSTGAAR